MLDFFASNVIDAKNNKINLMSFSIFQGGEGEFFEFYRHESGVFIGEV